MSKYDMVSDMDLLQELERVSCAVNTAEQLASKWARTVEQTKTELGQVQWEIKRRRLENHPEVKVGDLHAGQTFEGSVRGEYFVMKVEGFNLDHAAVFLSGQNENDVIAKGWAKCDDVKVKRIF